MHKAITRYKKFNFKDPDEVVSRNIPLSSKSVLVDLGRCIAVAYESGKEGKLRHYEHKFGKGARLLSSEDGTTLLIVGNKIRVTDWIRG